MEIREIFENYIKIEPKVMSIESLFNNEDRVSRTNYKPSYQRNYVWDDEKATYFIESILLGTEIPPLIYFRSSDKVEVIDGRQRYQTILRFINNEFKLKKNGLQKLDNIGIANKYFKNIEEKLKLLFWDTKLRIIEFGFHSKNLVNDEMEEIVKKEIFKRYNSGITPLKPTDIDKAAYIDDDLNSFFKSKINGDRILYDEVSGLLHFENSNIEIILKKIRQLLVLHKIPIKYYSVKKDSVISRFFEFLSSNIEGEEIEELYNSFIQKINLIKRVRNILTKENATYNRLIFECLFWAFSIIEEEKSGLQNMDASTLESLATYVRKNSEAFTMERSSFSKELHHRYLITSQFFREKFKIDFTAYLQNNPEFKSKNKQVGHKGEEMTSFEELRINKPEPSSIAIDDICRQMERQRFLIRPSYQRNEVINKKKSSAIIESILMGIKLPPIFVFKRKDDVSEVLDGQQRLLSILGFMNKSYLDENNKVRFSDKNGYSLNLKNGILKNISGKTFDQLTKDEKDKIKNFDLWIIEISEKNNQQFESIDLFIRLNNKPYPIKEDTFEMWNSYISRDIIETIKSIHRNNMDWFYLRKNNSRMEDENIYTSLAYLQYQANKEGFTNDLISKHLDIYKVGDRINLRVKSKIEITKVLESGDTKTDFIKACYDFEFDFLKKLKELLSDDSNSVNSVNKNFDSILNKDNNRRTQQSFYALWYFLYDIPYINIIEKKRLVRNDLKKLLSIMDNVKDKDHFDERVHAVKEKYLNKALNKTLNVTEKVSSKLSVFLGTISVIQAGINANNLEKFSKQNSNSSFLFFRDPIITHYKISGDILGRVSLDEKGDAIKEHFESKNKIILKRTSFNTNRLLVGMSDERAVFSSNFFVCVINRYGYDPRFVLGILGSRLVYFLIVSGLMGLNNQNNLPLNIVKNLPLPIVSLSNQVPFIRIMDYILSLETDSKLFGFFERLLDVMTYELYFTDELTEAGCNVLEHLIDLPDINSNKEDRAAVVFNIYERLSDTSNPVSSALIKILNIKEIIEIEGVI